MNPVLVFLIAIATWPQVQSTAEPRRLEIELLYLDMTECTRCSDAGKRLDEALTLLRPIMAETGWYAGITKTHVTSEEQARTLRLASSPTVRINGQDIQLDSRESVCADCSKLGNSASITCREWRYRDAWFASPPTRVFIEAIMKAMVEGGAKTVAGASTTTPFEVPENLKRFFASTKASSSRPSCCSENAHDDETGCCESRPATGQAAASRPACCSESGHDDESGCCESRPGSEKDGCCTGDGADARASQRPGTAATACTLSPESRTERKKMLTLLKRSVVERKDLENGLSFRFKPEAGAVARVAEIVDLERDCCQFLTFHIRVEGKAGAIWLDVTGSPGTKPLIEEYFGHE